MHVNVHGRSSVRGDVCVRVYACDCDCVCYRCASRTYRQGTVCLLGWPNCVCLPGTLDGAGHSLLTGAVLQTMRPWSAGRRCCVGKGWRRTSGPSGPGPLLFSQPYTQCHRGMPPTQVVAMGRSIIAVWMFLIRKLGLDKPNQWWSISLARRSPSP
jgi:hypothetical protein